MHPAAVAAWLGLAALLFLGAVLRPDPEAVRAVLAELGPFAPLAFVAAEAFQVIVVPVPGQPFEVPGGWVFGLAAGTALASVGAIAGSLVAFGLGRRYGRPWVERRVRPELRRRFESRFAGRYRAGWVVFWLMLLPAFPRDPLCYLAGLTDLRARHFALIAVVGRPAGLVPWVALGAGSVRSALALQLGILGAAAALWAAHRAAGRWLGRRAAVGPAAAGGGRHA